MLFSSPEFFVFFIVYLTIHLLIPVRFRLYLIIAGSAFFYGWWNPVFIGLPFVLSAIAYFAGRAVAAKPVGGDRRSALFTGLVLLFAPLALIKYTNFVYLGVVGMFIPVDAPILEIGLPPGISFITFTLAAYVIDVYRGDFVPLRRPASLVGYVLFFPHLIAGPILRPRELIPQLVANRPALSAKFKLGLVIFAIGLVKKVIFADQLAAAVDPIYAPGGAADGWAALLALYGFSLQIYCDFSGYTDMAIGLAYMLRVRLPTNFRTPYLAASPIEFWRRWHITLSHWLRDYLYFPLGGGRGGSLLRARNLMITMILGGLWHGANWTFMVWGAVHGVALVVAHCVRNFNVVAVITRPIAIALTFHFVAFAWIFFRAPDMATAWRVISGIGNLDFGSFIAFARVHIFEIGLLLLFFLTHRFDRQELYRLWVKRVPTAILIPAIVLAFILTVTVSQGSSAKFIYFDF